MKWVDELRFNEQGLIPVVVQADSGMVLMLAWANRKRWSAPEYRRAWFWAFTRELWGKRCYFRQLSTGTRSAMGLRADALLYGEACGPACHTGAASCFYQGQVLEPQPSLV